MNRLMPTPDWLYREFAKQAVRRTEQVVKCCQPSVAAEGRKVEQLKPGDKIVLRVTP